MSSWRRQALQLLPEQRRAIDRAGDPNVLWRELHSIAVIACSTVPIDALFIRRLFQYAHMSGSCVDPSVRSAVQTEFYEKLFDDDVARPHLQRMLTETQFSAVEPALASRFSPPRFARLRSEFYRALAEEQAATTLGELRRIKDEILVASSASARCSSTVHLAWARALGLLEVGEEVVGAEIFVDSLSELPVSLPHSVELRLERLLDRLGSSRRAP